VQAGRKARRRLLTKKEKRGFPSLPLSAENQEIDFPCFLIGDAGLSRDSMSFVVGLRRAAKPVAISLTTQQ